MNEKIYGKVRKENGRFWLYEAEKGSRTRWLCESLNRKLKSGDMVEARALPGFRCDSLKLVSKNNDPDSEIRLMAAKHALPGKFPDKAVAEAAAMKPAGLDGRLDWRDIPFVTIDPASAKDHDDAVYAEPLPGGGMTVYVAIADVAHYVRPDSALDKEARRRGNSTYLARTVLPMLPEKLSTDLCSLKQGQDRPALVVCMVFDADGNRTGHTFHRVLIRSRHSLAYEDVKQSNLPEIANLKAAYGILKLGRKKRNPLELHSPEYEFKFDADNRPVSTALKPELAAHGMIEEMMIQANVCASLELEKHEIPHLRRCHGDPDPDRIAALKRFMQSKNIKADGDDREICNAAARKLGGVAAEAVLRTQSMAEYTPNNYGHFGLGLSEYAHFTSPIRRYADLTVHRGLIAVLENGKFADDLHSLALDLNETERRSISAERGLKDRLAVHLTAKHRNRAMDGVVCGVINGGLFVRVETGAEGFVPFRDLDEWTEFWEGEMAAVGESSGYGWQFGDEVKVVVKDINADTGSLTLNICSEPRDIAGWD